MEYLSQNLEPYLKSGLSVNKALKEAGIANSEFYKYMSENELFGEKIRHFRNFISVLVSSALVSHLMDIARKQMGYGQPHGLSKDDVDFLRWFALHSNHTAGEYGRRIRESSFHPRRTAGLAPGMDRGDSGLQAGSWCNRLELKWLDDSYASRCPYQVESKVSLRVGYQVPA